jgi:quercetin dioxygenase-like cupin family protein
VLSGALEFIVEGRPVVVRPGEILHLPANEQHGARALEDTVVLDVFSPPRQDWGAPPAE